MEFNPYCDRFHCMNSRNSARMILLAAIALGSTDALFTRLSGSSSAAVPFYRELFSLVTLGSVCLLSKIDLGKAVRTGGFPLALSAVCMSLTGITFTIATQHAGSSIALIYYGLSPFFAAILSFIWLREKPSKLTVIAILMSACGIIWMNRNGIGSVPLKYHLVAMLSPICLALNFTNQRRHQNIDRRVSCALGALFGIFFCLFMASGRVALPLRSILPLMVFGLLIAPVGMLAQNLSTKRLPSFEVSLISSTECVFGILWVFIFLGERPTTDALIGAVVIFIAIVLNNLQEFRREPQKN